MTTPCELTLYSNSKSKADTIAQLILKEAKRLEKKYNYFDADSYLSQINQRLTNGLDSETKNILQRTKQYYKATDGVFDVTVATIKDIFREASSIEVLEQQKAALMPYVGCEHFSIKREKIHFDNDFTKIDLGGFVKEYAIDQAVKILRKHKIKAALINFGGDIYALGKKPTGEKFKVGISDPTDKQKHIKQFELEDQALTTSASYERNYTIAKQTFSHIIDTGNSATKPLSVTVISNNCVESGVYSTSLMLEPTLTTAHQTFIVQDNERPQPIG